MTTVTLGALLWQQYTDWPPLLGAAAQRPHARRRAPAANPLPAP